MDQQPPVIPYTPNEAPLPGASVIEHKPCVGCSYDLVGLPVVGKCPECGLEIQRSLMGDLLAYAGPEYLAKLHRGVVWIQGALIAMVAVTLLLILAGLAMGAGAAGAFGSGSARATMAASKQWLDVMGQALQVLIAIASAWGWWQYSDPDPGQLSTNKGEGPRKWIRITTIAHVAMTLGGFVLQLVVATGLMAPIMPGPGGGIPPGAIAVLVFTGLFSLLGLAVTATWFFASMRYISWLAQRVPNEKSIKQAKLMMWLGPVLCTVGALACGLGPIAAMIIFYIQLDWMRLDIKRTRVQQRVDGVCVSGSMPVG